MQTGCCRVVGSSIESHTFSVNENQIKSVGEYKKKRSKDGVKVKEC